MYCPKCGKEAKNEWARCPYCGNLLPGRAPQAPLAGPAYAQPPRPSWKSGWAWAGIAAGGLFLLAFFYLYAGDWLLQKINSGRQKDPPGAATVISAEEDSGGAAGLLNLTPTFAVDSPTPDPVIPTFTLPPTLTPWPTVTPEPTATLTQTPSPTPVSGAWQPCPNTYPSRLHTGNRAYVAFDPPLDNRVRVRPDTSSNIEGTIKPGEEVLIVGGPLCAENWVWWQVSAKNKTLSGWTSEGDMEAYWLVPLP